jgi:hypothetical protein
MISAPGNGIMVKKGFANSSINDELVEGKLVMMHRKQE